MDELIDILDKSGNFTGKTALKSEAHSKGLFHQTIHVWCYTNTGKVLLQQRGAEKETYPLKWDVSVAGHIAAGESPKLGAFREVEEEIGLTIDLNELEKLTVLKKEVKHPNGIWDREFTHIFLYRLDENTKLTKQDEEVEALQWLTISELQQWIKQKANLIPGSEKRLKMIITEIKTRLKANQ